MNSLEWIDAEITKWQEILESFKEQLIQVKGTRKEQTTLNHIEFYELRLKYLHQIKSELEAWKVAKNVLNTFDIKLIEGILIGLCISSEISAREEQNFKKALEAKENEENE